jgi:hypothetical protein
MADIVRIGNVAHLLTQWMFNDTGVNAAVGGRIHGAHIRDADMGTTLASGPLLVVTVEDAALQGAGGLRETVVEITSWSQRGGDEARTISDLAGERMQREEIRVTGLSLVGHNPREVDIAANGYAPAYAAWFVRTRFALMVC